MPRLALAKLSLLLAMTLTPLHASARCMEDTLRLAYEKNALHEEGGAARGEQRLLLNAASAFLNVAEARQVLALRQLHTRTLEQVLESTRAGSARDATGNADIAQAELRLAEAEASKAQAEGRLQAVRMAHLKITGQEAPDCALPPLPATLPKSREEAVELVASTPGAQADYTQSANFEGMGGADGVSLPWQVYSGMPYAVYSPIEAAASAWDEFAAARYSRTLVIKTTDAARRALEGMEAERAAGKRTVMEVLDADRDLLQARLNQIHAEKTLILQAYRLLAATGRLTAGELQPGDSPSVTGLGSARLRAKTVAIQVSQ